MTHGKNKLPLGTANWRTYAPGTMPKFKPGDFWVGRLPTGEALGIGDDRHVLVVGGTRGGKGVSILVPNLILWPGSAVVIDPKGENAMLTARRRGDGSRYSRGMGQKVWILDPVEEVRTREDDFRDIRKGFNPLTMLSEDRPESVDIAGRIADALIVSENSSDPFWEDSGRSLLKAVILHIVSWNAYIIYQNLVTVRRLLAQGKVDLRRFMAMNSENGGAPSAYGLLFEEMSRNPAFGGVVAAAGEWFGELERKSERTFASIMQVVRTNTDFIEGHIMEQTLIRHSFNLSDLKTQAATLYLCLPQRYMETHYRWLRMMVTLIVGEMERTQGPSATGHQMLMMLDEFAMLRRMRVIENAAAQLAGFGVKMVFVTQTLAQMKDIYKDNWETLVANAGTRIFFSNDDNLTREYASRLVGETETVREGRNHSESASQSSSRSTSETITHSQGTSGSSSNSMSHGGQGSAQYSNAYSSSFTSGLSHGISRSTSFSNSQSKSDGMSESIQKRPLITADEVGRFFGNLNDPAALVLVSGHQPIATRRVAYFQEKSFRGYFDAHPRHPRPPTLLEIEQIELKERQAAAAQARADEQARIHAAAAARREKEEREYSENLKREGQRKLSELRELAERRKRRTDRIEYACLWIVPVLAFVASYWVIPQALSALLR